MKNVAPLAGAWIEITQYEVGLTAGSASLPLRERGLKLLLGANYGLTVTSLPLRERGLKFGMYWGRLYGGAVSLPLRERGLKSMVQADFSKGLFKSLPLRERGLKWNDGLDAGHHLPRRSPCGSVD